MKDDNLGLGAKTARAEVSQPGIDAFQNLLGRLNGKDIPELEKEQETRSEIRGANFVEKRWGYSRFVSGGLLVGDRSEEAQEEKKPCRLPRNEASGHVGNPREDNLKPEEDCRSIKLPDEASAKGSGNDLEKTNSSKKLKVWEFPVEMPNLNGEDYDAAPGFHSGSNDKSATTRDLDRLSVLRKPQKRTKKKHEERSRDRHGEKQSGRQNQVQKRKRLLEILQIQPQDSRACLCLLQKTHSRYQLGLRKVLIMSDNLLDGAIFNKRSRRSLMLEPSMRYVPNTLDSDAIFGNPN